MQVNARGGATSACHNALYVKHQQVFPVPVATSLFTLSVSPPAFYRFQERAHKGQDVHGSLSLLSKDSIRRVYSFHRCSRHARGESIPDVSPCAAFVEARVRRFHLAPTNYPAAVFFRLLIKRHESVCARRRWQPSEIIGEISRLDMLERSIVAEAFSGNRRAINSINARN